MKTVFFLLIFLNFSRPIPAQADLYLMPIANYYFSSGSAGHYLSQHVSTARAYGAGLGAGLSLKHFGIEGSWVYSPGWSGTPISDSWQFEENVSLNDFSLGPVWRIPLGHSPISLGFGLSFLYSQLSGTGTWTDSTGKTVFSMAGSAWYVGSFFRVSYAMGPWQLGLNYIAQTPIQARKISGTILSGAGDRGGILGSDEAPPDNLFTQLELSYHWGPL